MTPTARQVKNGTYLLIDAQWHKRCVGPAHDGSVYLPATEKYFYRHKSGVSSGKLTAHCRLCQNWSSLKLKGEGSEHGWVRLEDVRWVFIEAVNRAGVMELSRRTGLSRITLVKAVKGSRERVQKMTVRLVLLELISMKRKGEFPVVPGSAWRTVARLNNATRVCQECGTVASNFTEGCSTCVDRRAGRKKRMKTAKVAM